MNSPIPIAFVVLALLGACAQPVEEKKLPEDAPKASFTFSTESLLRGVNGSHNTVPRGRPAAILDVTYNLSCLSEGSSGASQRFKAAKSEIDKAYSISPLYFDNPREHGEWRRSASRAVFETGCEVTGLSFTEKSTSPSDVLRWVIKNRVPPVS